jgi:S1-C subfamily serine protease
MDDAKNSPSMSYTSRFARPPEPEAPAAPPASPEAAPSRTLGKGRLALIAGLVVLLAVTAAALGALVGHQVWTTNSTPSAASDTGGAAAVQPPSTPIAPSAPSTGNGSTGTFGGPGGFSITVGPNGIKINPPGGSGSGSSGTASPGPGNRSALAAKVSPALVDINVASSFQGVAGAGTGIVLSSDGKVLTNNHVIDGATHITATDIGNGKTYAAKVVGYDPSHDLAVIQLQGASGLATATLGDSSKVAVGDKVLGLGNAGGAGGAPSRAGGTITGIDKTITAGDAFGGKTEQLSGLLQMSANVQPGDSGGAVVDTQGHVIGLITAANPDSGFGFGFRGGSAESYAIPINAASATAAQMISGHGSATVHVGASAFLGVQLSSDLFGSGGGSGVTVGGVLSGQPAARAGLAAGDVITSIDGRSVGTSDDISSLMFAHHPGDTIKLTWTDATGQSKSASVTLASGPPA